MDKKNDRTRLFLGSFTKINKIFPENFQEKLQSHFDCPLRFVKKENLHLTWKFLGDRQTRHIPDFINIIEKSLKDISNISIHFNKLELWPDARFPRQLVITGEDLNGKATGLYNNLNNKFQKFGLKKEKRKFNPHITIARFKLKQKPEKPFVLPDNLELTALTMNFQEMILINSLLSSQGSTYTPVKSFIIPQEPSFEAFRQQQ